MQTGITTAEELLQLPGIECRHELISGQLKKLPFRAWQRAEIAGDLGARLGPYVLQHELGKLFAAGTGFLIRRNPDTVLSPDLAFVAKNRFSDDLPQQGYWLGAPDLSVEILQTDGKSSEVVERAVEWLAAGCAAVWSINPELQSVNIFQSLTNVQVKVSVEMLSDDRILPGFTFPVDELFQHWNYLYGSLDSRSSSEF